MSTAAPSRAAPKNTRRGASIQLERELAEPLQEFGKKVRLSGADVVRVILAFGLPKLLSGEMAIVNGELRHVDKGA